MADKAVEKKNAQAVKPEPVKKSPEPIYTLEEFIAVSDRVIGEPAECVVAAFRMEKKTEATIEEAKKIVEKFLGRKVKK